MKYVKNAISLLLIVIFMISACGPKPYYKTKEGKKKLKFYNEKQFDRGQP